MAHHYTPTPSKTYATRANAIKAVEKVCGPNCERFADSELRYVVMCDEAGRFYPLFIGEAALRHQMFVHFCVMM
jgi:hypothetical protein